MTPSPIPFLAVRTPLLALCSGAGLLLGGCMTAHKGPAISWNAAALIHPIIPSPLSPADQALPEVTSVPSAGLVLPRTSLVTNHIAPPRPHAPALTPSSGESGKPAAPVIVPQISAQESANAQQAFNASLSAAERNLEYVRGKALNSTQIDISNKVKSFLSDAREAARLGDWPRASALAKKAQVLAEDLARSL